MNKSRNQQIEETRWRHAELERQPLPIPRNIRVSSPRILEKLRNLGHRAELIQPAEMPEILEKLRDPDEDRPLR